MKTGGALLKRLILLILTLCLLSGLCACEEEPLPDRSVSAASVREEALRPTQTTASLELDGAAAGPLFALADQSYVKTEALSAVWPLTCSEGSGTLRLELDGSVLTLWDGRSEAERADGSRIALSAPVLREADGWYLPASALRELWGRTLVRDDAENVLRCLRLTEGPELRFNGETLGMLKCCNGVPVLSAAQAELVCGGNASFGADADGTPMLTLRAGSRVLTFRQGALRAELDGAETYFSAPAWHAGEDWYLPAAAAEMLGCTLLDADDSEQLVLARPEDGPLCWFDGVGIGQAKRFGQVLCADATALAEAAGGTVLERGGTVILELAEHRLVLRPGQAEAEADGTLLELPFPVVPDGKRWLVPLEPVAALLGLSAQTDETAAIYSPLQPCSTVLLVDGTEAASYTRAAGGLYVRLSDVRDRIDGSFVVDGNEAVFQTRNGEMALRAGAAECVASGETLTLSAPTVVNGAEWYVSAPEVLPALGLAELADPELDRRYYTSIVKNESVPTGYRVPILMYHAIGDQIWGSTELFVSPSKLEEEIQAMLEAGYTPITFEDLGHVDEIEKPVMLTFDDGYDDSYSELLPLLKKYQIKATVFIIVDDLGARHKLTEEQVREMSESGLVSIQSHTMSHNFLDTMYEKQLRHENYDSMLALARLTGKQPFVMCYPTGKSSAYSRRITAEYYQFGLNMTGPCYVTGEEPYYIFRYYVRRDTSVEAILAYLEG